MLRWIEAWFLASTALNYECCRCHSGPVTMAWLGWVTLTVQIETSLTLVNSVCCLKKSFFSCFCVDSIDVGSALTLDPFLISIQIWNKIFLSDISIAQWENPVQLIKTDFWFFNKILILSIASKSTLINQLLKKCHFDAQSHKKRNCFDLFCNKGPSNPQLAIKKCT